MKKYFKKKQKQITFNKIKSMNKKIKYYSIMIINKKIINCKKDMIIILIKISNIYNKIFRN